MAFSEILRDAVGEEAWKKHVNRIFTDAGKGIKEIKDRFGLKGDDAKAVSEALILAPLVVFGPEVAIEITEAGKDRTVSKQTKCPVWNRIQEMGITRDPCSFIHACYARSGAQAINSGLTFTLTKAMTKGDPYCAWVVERSSRSDK